MEFCNGRKTPLDPNTFLTRTLAGESVDPDLQKKYQSIMGSVNFLSVVSRPTLSFTSSMLGSYAAAPSKTHSKMIFQTLRSLQETRDDYLDMSPRPQTAHLDAVMYSDASFGSGPDNGKSFSGYVLELNGCTITWSSKRHTSAVVYIALSGIITILHSYTSKLIKTHQNSTKNGENKSLQSQLITPRKKALIYILRIFLRAKCNTYCSNYFLMV